MVRVYCTFLQAATFNFDIVHAVASAIGDEVRAKVRFYCVVTLPPMYGLASLLLTACPCAV